MSKLFSASHVHVGVLNDYVPENRPITVVVVAKLTVQPAEQLSLKFEWQPPFGLFLLAQ